MSDNFGIGRNAVETAAGRDDRRYLDLALSLADLAEQEGSLPVGAVVVGPDGEVLGTGRNRILTGGGPTAHAEMEALYDAGARLGEPASKGNCTVYTTMEPCLMCAGALLLSEIARVVWVVNDPKRGALRDYVAHPGYADLFAKLTMTETPDPQLAVRMRAQLAAWFARQGWDNQRWLE